MSSTGRSQSGQQEQHEHTSAGANARPGSDRRLPGTAGRIHRARARPGVSAGQPTVGRHRRPQARERTSRPAGGDSQVLAAIRERLGSGAYVGQALRELAAPCTNSISALAQLKQSAAGDSELREARPLAEYRKVLEAVVGFEGLPYSDSDTGGTQMTPGGRQLLSDTRQAIK